MKVWQLIDTLEDLPMNADVWFGGDSDIEITDVVQAGSRRVILMSDSQPEDDVITLDIVGPSETNRWQIVYSSGVLQHQPVGREVLDYLVAESVVARIYRKMPAFVEALNANRASEFVNGLLDYGDNS